MVIFSFQQNEKKEEDSSDFVSAVCWRAVSIRHCCLVFEMWLPVIANLVIVLSSLFKCLVVLP